MKYKCKPLPPLSLMRERLSYSPTDGTFTWLVKSNSCAIGAPAGSWVGGYRKIKIDGIAYLAHRIAWTFMTGRAPPDIIDHINGDPSDNRWANLRAATPSQNVRNSRVQKDKALPFKGVSWVARDNRYKARISVDGRNKYLGYFKTPEEASAAYLAASVKYFGEFANDGSESSLNNPLTSADTGVSGEPQ